MRTTRLIFWVIIIFFSTIELRAQNNSFHIGAELRPRFILDNGYKKPKTLNEKPVPYISQRTKLNLGFENSSFEMYVSFLDIRLWGDDNNYSSSGAFGNTGSTFLHQAWARINLTKNLSLKAGRQILSYDDQRILSARNWKDSQLSYDALLAEYNTGNHRVHLGLSYNADNKSVLTFPAQKFKTIDFLHYRFKREGLTLSALALASGNTLSDTTEQLLYRGTYGSNASYKTDNYNVQLSAYYQHNLNNISGDISAFYISAYAEHSLAEKINFGLGYDYHSGNDEISTSASDNWFDILYGGRHGWYGYMDYFITAPDQGLQDYMAKLSYSHTKNLSIHFDLHYYSLAVDKRDYNNPSVKLNRQLGQELDIKIKWILSEPATLECGYSFYKPTNTLKQIKNLHEQDIKTPQFFYFMITLKPFANIITSQ